MKNMEGLNIGRQVVNVNVHSEIKLEDTTSNYIFQYYC